MASSARAALSEAIEEYGVNGRLLVFHEPGDPWGRRSRLREKVAEANARSRGEILWPRGQPTSTTLPFASSVWVSQYTSHLSSTCSGTLPSG
jgi:hypothetical protein